MTTAAPHSHDTSFCRANCLDPSALVKLHVNEDGADIIRTYFDHEPTKYTTPFCFYEALTLQHVNHP